MTAVEIDYMISGEDWRDRRRGLARSAATLRGVCWVRVRPRHREQRSGGGSWVSQWSLNDALIPLKPRSRKKAG
ncbi:hypothetical protein CMV_019216 [Castanea mollissima]|uniref:Uncharacterized protein n=1 Tax=Castanea mollissima TaxID=60419 RepID=A0A8J4QQ78_9ROSI|nr:hypothetical protein CMV_019216 [Castanea mollissima]